MGTAAAGNIKPIVRNAAAGDDGGGAADGAVGVGCAEADTVAAPTSLAATTAAPPTTSSPQWRVHGTIIDMGPVHVSL